MANIRKKISELTALTSASLDTTIVGVDNGTTYKIELDTLADAVTSRVNVLDRSRLSSLESVTSSFESKGRSMISSSAQISALGFTTSSSDLTSLNSFTSSFNSYTASISTASLVTSITNLNTYTASQSTSSLVNRLNAIESVSGSWITESETGSFLTNLNGAISGSSQLTSSYDSRYVLSGSITQTTWDNISGKPSGLVSQSTDLTSLNNFTASISTASLVTSINNLNTYTASQSTASLVTSITNLNNATSSYETMGRGIISGSSQLTSSYDARYTLSGSVSAVPSGTISGSAQITAFGFISASGAIPSGTISGSSQLTASFDLRYLVTGSVTASINALNTFSASENTKATTLATYTSSLNTWTSSVATTGSNSFNGNQTITGSLNVSSIAVVSSSFTANSSSLTLNSGSNLYIQNNGIVEITGSLLVSGSNNINLVSPVLQIGTGSGDEGGEILLAKAITNTTLTGSGVTVDVYRDRIRIFEQGGAARGVYIDLAKTPGGVAGELMWKASGMVDAGTFVTLDNIKATLTSSGNRGLSIAAVSSTFTATYAGTFNNTAGAGGNSSNGTISVTTTPTTSLFGWNFAGQGDLSTYVLSDITNNRAYRITLQIGGSYLNNFIMIERLH